MSDLGKSERATQNRIKQLFQEELGYRFLGDWHDRANSCIEEELLKAHLGRQGYSPAQIRRALYLLGAAADTSRGLYLANKAVYALLRYGVPVKEEADKVTETVHLVDWKHPQNNDFALAEEVTLRGGNERRPDLVLYLNGIAVGVIELKRSSVSIGEGLRQSISNQRPEFNEWFYATVQLVFAGNDSEGLRYGTIGTEEKQFLTWKEDVGDNSGFKLDKYLRKMCRKERLLELIHDFVIFDGRKKLPRVHQYFGVKAAQEHVEQKKGGIIWHSQGSGKSIVMVLLAKWIMENNPAARVVIITDRDELDKQIEGVFRESNEPIVRTSSGADLMSKLSQAAPRLLCSLIHKFGLRDVGDFEAFIKELEARPSQTVGEVFVFVDECHRTQSGKLHRAMKALMPNAIFIGFTGTPLLKKDAQTSMEVFGGYIHTYKFNEAVEDKVVLDLIYEARDIDQHLESEEEVDAWFERATRGLNNWQKDELKKQWGTMQKVLSSKSRMERVISDIFIDFHKQPRLLSGNGNAMLVASSIYEACKYFSLLQATAFKNKCAVVTSYNPQAKDITLEDIGGNSETDKVFVYSTYIELLKDVVAQGGKSKTEVYEDNAKERFIKDPAGMCLLVVVDKLLTGFDAPPCTYLYIDKSMQDHGLFQAICRTNRLDGETKDFGYIVDYKNLFKKVENAIAVYTSELDLATGGGDPQILLKDRLKKGKEQLDNSVEALVQLCVPVEPPRRQLDYFHYFCGNPEIASELAEREPQRVALYKNTASLVRAYANIADEMEEAGYSPEDKRRIQGQVEDFVQLRNSVRLNAGETLDLKAYEADMRDLIDTYIDADRPKRISAFENFSLIELIVKTGINETIVAELNEVKDREAVAEVIENNVRSKIIKEALHDPAYYERMSKLLNEIIALRKAKAIEYEEFLKRIAELAKRVLEGQEDATPPVLNTPGKRALYNNLQPTLSKVAEFRPAYNAAPDPALALAMEVDQTVRRVKQDDWQGNEVKERHIMAALYAIIPDEGEVMRVFGIIKTQTEYR